MFWYKREKVYSFYINSQFECLCEKDDNSVMPSHLFIIMFTESFPIQRANAYKLEFKIVKIHVAITFCKICSK